MSSVRAEEETGISVVLCCRNSSARLPETVRHLRAQRLDAGTLWEVIFVDNGSTDGTAETAIRECSKKEFPAPFRVTEQPVPGSRAAAEKGVEVSSHDFITFVDDDNWLDPGYLPLAYHLMRMDPSIGVLGGRGVPVFEEEPPAWFERYRQCFAVGSQREGSGEVEGVPGVVYGAGMTVRKAALRRLLAAGFESLVPGRKGKRLTGGEDNELCLAVRLAGYRVCYEERLVFRHFLPASRVNVDYLMRLTRAIHFSAVYLDPYYRVLAGDRDPADVKNYYWLKRVLKAARRLLVHELRNRRLPRESPEYLERQRVRQKLLARLEAWLFLRDGYAAHCRQVADLKRRLDAARSRTTSKDDSGKRNRECL